ncbi:hypothetical protein G5I_00125 [Acromyrmex echinatior]|uniref:Uncharacterized protein n=1 Tax=Acromyrmex echinatior TaxID=103372 RepID=F4W420_ACREC|nr:hypothetical protein G5I_00125 [Acromyrmex echinatior]
MREVSSERYKNFYPGSTSGIYQHRQGAADFLSDFLVYPIPVELRREIPLGWQLLALLERDEIRIRKEINYPFSKAEVSRLKGIGLPCVRYDDVTHPVGKTIVKAKQWAFGLRPIHLSRAFESGEAPERGKNGKQHDPVAGSTASMAKRDIAKKLISRLTVCELLYDPRVLLFGISYYLANKVSHYSPILRFESILNNGVAGVSVQESLQPKVQVEYPLNVPVLISAELAAPRRGSRQLVRRGRGHERAKKPGKLVPRLRELRGDFGRKSVASGWCLVLAGHPVHTPHLPRFTARVVPEVMPEVTRTEVKLTPDAPLCAISSKNVQNVVIRLAEEFCKQHDA